MDTTTSHVHSHYTTQLSNQISNNWVQNTNPWYPIPSWCSFLFLGFSFGCLKLCFRTLLFLWFLEYLLFGFDWFGFWPRRLENWRVRAFQTFHKMFCLCKKCSNFLFLIIHFWPIVLCIHPEGSWECPAFLYFNFWYLRELQNRFKNTFDRSKL